MVLTRPHQHSTTTASPLLFDALGTSGPGAGGYSGGGDAGGRAWVNTYVSRPANKDDRCAEAILGQPHGCLASHRPCGTRRAARACTYAQPTDRRRTRRARGHYGEVEGSTLPYRPRADRCGAVLPCRGDAPRAGARSRPAATEPELASVRSPGRVVLRDDWNTTAPPPNQRRPWPFRSARVVVGRTCCTGLPAANPRRAYRPTTRWQVDGSKRRAGGGRRTGRVSSLSTAPNSLTQGRPRCGRLTPTRPNSAPRRRTCSRRGCTRCGGWTATHSTCSCGGRGAHGTRRRSARCRPRSMHGAGSSTGNSGN